MRDQNHKSRPARISVALAILIVMGLATIFAKYLVPHDPVAINISNSLAPMSWDHPFGTDQLGRCVFSRCLYAIRVTFGASLFIAFLTIVLGSVIGMAAAYLGGLVDQIVRVLSDALLAIPSMIFTLIIVGFLGPGTQNIILAMLIANWVWYARVARGLTLRIREYGYVRAARLAGTGHLGIIAWHIFPGIVTQMTTQFTLLIGTMALSIAGFSFLGIGIQPPTAELGLMISDGCELIQTHFFQMVWPSLALILPVASLNVIGDYFSDYWRSKQ
ncbi:MAG: ABC transporter permease [Deltaproteobacteria bacterium]|nr:ABC transporter permease [Deltaproteobacteria bacterium]